MAIIGVNKQELSRFLDIQAAYGNIFNESDTYIMDGLFFKYVLASNEMVRIEPLGNFRVEFTPSDGDSVGQGFTPPLMNFNRFTGWKVYRDTQYTQGSPWQPTKDVWTNVPNNGLFTNPEVEAPEDLPDGFYDPITGKLFGKAGDGIAVVTEIGVTPRGGGTPWMDTAFFIGGTGGPLGDGRVWQGTLAFPKGDNEPRIHNHTTVVFVGQDVADNGGFFQVRPATNVDIYGIGYSFFRVHKARGD